MNEGGCGCLCLAKKERCRTDEERVKEKKKRLKGGRGGIYVVFFCSQFSPMAFTLLLSTDGRMEIDIVWAVLNVRPKPVCFVTQKVHGF